MLQGCLHTHAYRSSIRDCIVHVEEQVTVPLAGARNRLDAWQRTHMGVVIVEPALGLQQQQQQMQQQMHTHAGGMCMLGLYRMNDLLHL